MLAITPITDRYLTAAELKITEKEREALIWVREELAIGRIKHDPDYRGGGFNMTDFDYYGHCGTSHCIGGWMRTQLGTAWDVLQPVFSALFLPNCSTRYKHQTPAQAVRAIDAWATGAGDRCWAIALEAD